MLRLTRHRAGAARAAVLVLAAVVVSRPLAAQRERGVSLPDSMEMRTGRTSTIRVVPYVLTGPLTGIGLGTTGLWLSGPEGDTITRPTSVRALFLYTQKRQAIAEVWVDLWAMRNTWRIDGELEAQLFPTPFFGLGPIDPGAVAEDYDLESIGGVVRGTRRVAPGVFVTLGPRWRVSRIVPRAEGGLIDRGGLSGDRGGTYLGLEGGVQWDTRDNIVTATRGAFVSVGGAVFDRTWGSRFSWQTLTVDVRRYVPIGGRQVLAFQMAGGHAFGAVPFDYTPNFGGPPDLRAYVNNRWRDNTAVLAQMEYRRPIAGRFGFVAHAGLGAVAPRIADYRLDEVRRSAGIGLRYAIVKEPQANIRLDFAVGQQNRALVLTFGEAF